MDARASFNLSYERLDAAARAVFEALGAFPGDFDAAAAEAVAEDANHRQLSELVRRSLAQYDAKTGRYRLHDLLRVYARERSAPETTAAAEQRHAAHYATVLAQADDHFLSGNEGVLAGLRLYDTEAANIAAGRAWASSHRHGDDHALRLCVAYPDAGAYVLNLRQTPRQRIEWLELRLDAARQLGNKEAEGNALGNLGLAYADLGEVRRAIEFYEQALAIAREIGDRRGEGNALENMSMAYCDHLGEKAQGVPLAEAALAIYEAIEDPNAAKVREWLARWKEE